jgi:hypothetical protein
MLMVMQAIDVSMQASGWAWRLVVELVSLWVVMQFSG